MGTMASSEFRKRYAGLRERTVVTVNGSALGEWIPAGVARAEVAAAVDAIEAAVAHLRRELAAMPPARACRCRRQVRNIPHVAPRSVALAPPSRTRSRARPARGDPSGLADGALPELASTQDGDCI